MRSSSAHNIHKNFLPILTGTVGAIVLLSVLQDKVEAGFRNSSFYFSESFMFSAFWWLFIPLIYFQWNTAARKQVLKPGMLFLLSAIPVLLHSVLYPGLVWLLSRLFYYHTYPFNQTFRFGLSNYGYQLIIFYTGSVLLFKMISKKEAIVTNKTISNIQAPVSGLLVSEGRKKINLPVSSISYFSSSSPYIVVHSGNKKYLSGETLKSVEGKLPPDQFIRIHKSNIVNIKLVTSFQSRLNGDYDLFMMDGTVLRVSRNFAAAFKNLFAQSNRVTTK